MTVRENISLKAFNTFGIDVTARTFAAVNDLDDIKDLIGGSAFSGGRFLILGGGSNVLFNRDFDGLIVKNDIGGISHEASGPDEVIVTAGAGMEWNALVWHCIDNGWGGIENLTLIPGSVGAGPIQNIGAYGVELKDTFYSLDAIDLHTSEMKTFTRDECQFGYRDSIFKRELKGKFMIVSVSLSLNKNAVPDISYGAIRTELELMGVKDEPDIRAVGKAVSSIRRKKLPDPEEKGNAGSFFKNPVVTLDTLDELKNIYPSIPSYVLNDEQAKVPAGWLIEQCGWKGRSMGNAGVHEQQALVLVNHGGATGQEILALANAIKTSVNEKFGINLEKEVNVI
jgi:UDP-N-acetylmuramate dehydrogenase